MLPPARYNMILCYLKVRASLDHQKFSTIAHRDHEFYNPISAEKIDRVLRLIDLNPTTTAIDIGCGRGEMLIRLCEWTGTNGIGVDLNPIFIQRAQENAVGRVQDGQILWLNDPIADVDLSLASIQAALCIGSTHAYGDYQTTLQALYQFVKPGGYILIGEGYWKQVPAPEYLEFLDAKLEDYGTHADNIHAGEKIGLRPLYAVVSDDDDWDHYEGLYARAIELYTYQNPDDPDASVMRERIQKWREVYLKWGRTTLGFGLYLFLRP